MGQSSQLQDEASQSPALEAVHHVHPGKPSALKLLLFVLLSAVLLNFSSYVVDELFVVQAQNDQQHTTLRATLRFFQGKQGFDSLGPMLPAIHMLEHDPKAPVYQSIVFDNHTKFQYPLTSLLPFYLWQKLGASDQNLFAFSKVSIDICACLTILLTILIALKYLPSDRFERSERSERTLAGIAVGVGGLLFYPLITGTNFGQIQTLLTLGFTIAFCCWLAGYETAASVILGMMVCIKPQYGLFFLWALMRRKYKVAASGLACALAVLLISCFLFGWHNNIEYLRVLRYISSGEGYYPNQSANGLLNRLLFNGNNLVWDPKSFAPYNTIVYLGTVASSLALLALALFFPWGRDRRGKAADFACIILVSTMASPIAWQHHYAILLPVLVWLWFSDYANRGSLGMKWLFAIAYLLISNWIPAMAAFASIPVLNILQSYLYAGAILVLILLFRSCPNANCLHLVGSKSSSIRNI